MLWAAACMCFFSFLRCGEVVIPSDSTFNAETHLAYGDVRVNSVVDLQFMEVRLKVSKTDPFQLGVSVYLGMTNKRICPVAAILAYLVIRGSDPGPFFVLRMVEVSPGPASWRQYAGPWWRQE